MRLFLEAPRMAWMLLSFSSSSRNLSNVCLMHSRRKLVLSSLSTQKEETSSRWTRRTAKKRHRIGKLLDSIDLPKRYGPNSNTTTYRTLDVPILYEAAEIDWLSHPTLDPQGVCGGNLKPNSLRSLRKRRQIEAFCYALEHLILRTHGEEGDGFMHQPKKETTSIGCTLIDAGSGAGNLSIPMTAILNDKINKTYALDVNFVALERLQNRASELQLPIETICVDLAEANSVVERIKREHMQQLNKTDRIVLCSLHACGAATDLALRLATHHKLPFIVSPCCTAKAITQRTTKSSSSVTVFERKPRMNSPYGEIEPSASFQRSGAPLDVSYPRSRWLTSLLSENNNSAKEYSLLAKAADIGIGPQTSFEQIDHQRRAKSFVEIDRLMGVVENNDNYNVAIYRIKDHEMYGKSEILIGMP